MPDSTIIIPTFNRSKLLPRAIESALDQTVECEVIVVDHGSTDDTPLIMKKYQQRLKYIRREDDCGPIFAWLDGVINASGKFVHITYDDDWIDVDYMRRCLELFDKECAYVFTSTSVHYEDGSCKYINNDLFTTGVHKKKSVERILLNMQKTLSPGGGVFRKADIISALNPGGLPNGLTQYHGAGPDLLMFLLPLLKYKNFGYINEPLAHFFAHSNSITMSAGSHLESDRRLDETYANVRRYYLGLKYFQALKVGECIYTLRMIPVRLFRFLRFFFKKNRFILFK